jgi:formyltetrahydrofolate deformylase
VSLLNATDTDTNTDLVLTLSCEDKPGIVYEVAKFLVDQGFNIVESQQYDDRESNRFFMRVQFEPVEQHPTDLVELQSAFEQVAVHYAMDWRLVAASERHRVLIMVSKFAHCLNDLLFRAHAGDLNIDVVAVVSNHPDLAPMADQYRVPFHHIPIRASTKSDAEAQLLQLVDDLDVDLVVLARYMQILSAELCKALEGKAINIHHSMLPSFKGARPYFQAHERGVKLVGATAHYVTSDLDEGPIIEQEVARVDHGLSALEVTALGRDNECRALARAVKYHSENRILMAGRRTVVLAR